jgi:MFS family permease
MVGRDELPNAIALNTGLFNGSRIIGPAIAGVIIGLGGTGICFLVNTITFLAVLSALALMREDELFEVKRNPRTRAGAAIAEGIRFAWNNSEIRLALTVLAIASTVGFNFHVIIPVLASDTLNAGPEVFGVLSAFFGGGALLGALIQAARSKASWKALLIGATGFSAGLLALSPVETVAPACAVLFFVGICFTLWVSNTSAILQLRAPDALRGRVMSLFMFAFAGLAPIGGLFAGWLMEVGGTQLALSLGGSMSLVVVAYAWAKNSGVEFRRRPDVPMFSAEEEEASRAA